MDEKLGIQMSNRADTLKASADFSAVELRQFTSASFGLVFYAPASWQDTSDEQYFQLVDSETDAQFTASAFDNPRVSLQQWADTRLAAAEKGMPFLRRTKAPYEMNGIDWSGIAAEYQGTFPQRDDKSHYLVLCLRSEKIVFSFTVLAKVDVFAANEALYRWLLQSQLHIEERRAAG